MELISMIFTGWLLAMFILMSRQSNVDRLLRAIHNRVKTLEYMNMDQRDRNYLVEQMSCWNIREFSDKLYNIKEQSFFSNRQAVLFLARI